jgi:hypothetical protein
MNVMSSLSLALYLALSGKVERASNKKYLATARVRRKIIKKKYVSMEPIKSSENVTRN